MTLECVTCDKKWYGVLDDGDFVTKLPCGHDNALHAKRPKLTILEEAGQLVDKGEREQEYGPPEESFAWIAYGWDAIMKMKGSTISSDTAAMMMIWLKMVRECNQHKRDNIVDIAGYARLLERLTD
jgi:hypothetical protein